MFDMLMSSLDMVFTLENFGWAFFGVTVGMIMGAIPGLSDTIAIALLLPFTFYLGPIPGIAMLMGLSKGGNFGGSVPAILFNIPGTPQALITTLDGYPLAQQGKAGKALMAALFASVLADVLSDLVLIFLAEPVSRMALKIGPPEYTSILLFSLILIALAASQDPVRGLLATAIGLLLGCVGLDPETGTPRLMFDFIELADGVNLMPLVIGLMALSEVFMQMHKIFAAKFAGRAPDGVPDMSGVKLHHQRLTWEECKSLIPTLLRSTWIGSCVGIIPGIGTTVGSYLSYLAARKTSKHPEQFGKGALEGIVASEAGNNAVNGPNLIPLVTLGIPGNLAAALILGGFMIKGLTPGPMFMQSQADMLYALFILLLLSNVFTFMVGKVFIFYAWRLRAIPLPVLHAGILVYCVVGAFVGNGEIFNLWILFAAGVLGYVLILCRINLPILVVAFFLGNLLEHKLRQTLTLFDNDLTILATRPISCVFLGLTALVIGWYVVRLCKNRHAKSV